MGERSFFEHDRNQAEYEYARLFLRYLDAARELAELNRHKPSVDSVDEIIKNGRENDRNYRELSIKAERALNPRRNLNKLSESLECLVGRFYADYKIASDAEADSWKRLVDAVEAIQGAWDIGPWYNGDKDKQRYLLIADDRSDDRILHYQRRLSNALYENAPSPDWLEVSFRLSDGSLLSLNSVAL